MTTVLSFLYCFIGSVWACYWLEELCHGIYLDARMWPYLWRMGGHIVLWPFAATSYLIQLVIWPDWSHFPESSTPHEASYSLCLRSPTSRPHPLP